MGKNDTYEYTMSLVSGLSASVQEPGTTTDFAGFLRIRRELNHFLLNLNYSQHAEGAGQQVHYLFMALDHLDNLDREIRIAGMEETLINLERIHVKIRDLKQLLLEYIKHLTSETGTAV